MVIFISGSINSGKTTTGRALAKRLGGVFLDVDDLKAHLPGFDLSKDIPKIIEIATQEANAALLQDKPVVLSYVIRQKDCERIVQGLHDKNPVFITLAPKLHIAQSNRGGRELTEWEMERVKYHYDTGIASPSFGEVIDNSDMTVDQTVDKILDILKNNTSAPDNIIEHTSYGILPVFQKDNGAQEYLLLQSRGGFWGFPKGGPENGESPEATAIREAQEEAGLRIEREALTFQVDYKYQVPVHETTQTKRVVLFPVRVRAKDVVVAPNEIKSYKWASYDEAVKLIDLPGIAQVLQEVERHNFI